MVPELSEGLYPEKVPDNRKIIPVLDYRGRGIAIAPAPQTQKILQKFLKKTTDQCADIFEPTVRCVDRNNNSSVCCDAVIAN